MKHAEDGGKGKGEGRKRLSEDSPPERLCWAGRGPGGENMKHAEDGGKGKGERKEGSL